jgi:xanthine dehydrogenase YagS FAD-binding subunit
MRLGVMKPESVVDVTALPYRQIEELPDGGLRIGALVPNADVADHAVVQARYPVLAEAILAGASPQVRNLATTGGNLLQRTRCPYFRDPQIAQCNKRKPGAGCAAIGGYTRSHAVLGVSDKCIATHPSDQNVALVALDAIVRVKGPKGERTIPIDELHTLPGDTPEREHVLTAGELITHVDLPPTTAKSHYVKVRDRASFAFALASAAVALDIAGGTIKSARIGLGGIATKPWRSKEAEQALAGKPPSVAAYRAAADAALAGAKAQDSNRFKIDLAKRTLVRALTEIGGAT